MQNVSLWYVHLIVMIMFGKSGFLKVHSKQMRQRVTAIMISIACVVLESIVSEIVVVSLDVNYIEL